MHGGSLKPAYPGGTLLTRHDYLLTLSKSSALGAAALCALTAASHDGRPIARVVEEGGPLFGRLCTDTRHILRRHCTHPEQTGRPLVRMNDSWGMQHPFCPI